jgi:uracil-DNA glycosylase family 4
MQPRYAKPAECAGCSLHGPGFGFAPPVGPANARLIFIGEALGHDEAIFGEPFYGGAGGVLSRIMQRAGIHRPSVRIANVVSCKPPNDWLVGAPWEEHAIIQCRQYLQPVLDAVPQDAVVVPLGATALGAVLSLRGHAGIQVKDFHGTVSRSVDDRYWVVPTFHPSHLQRGAMNLLEVVTQDLALADRISQRGFVRSDSELVVDPAPAWFDRWVDEYLAAVALDPDGTHLTLDTEFEEKAGGADESEIVLGAVRSPITRVNGGRDKRLGWTVPYHQPYIATIERLLVGVGAVRGWIWLWNKYADLDHLRAAGHTLTAEFVDAMWAWKFLQSDIPRGLGFVAPMASDFGAWKHWSKDRALEGAYAAADGVQTWRTAMWILNHLHRANMYELFMRDWHDRDIYVLRPAFEQGTPMDRPALEAFHADLQVKLASVLERMKTTAAAGTLKPKQGYAKRPKGAKCDACGGSGEMVAGTEFTLPVPCIECDGTGQGLPKPPAGLLGKSKGGNEAKAAYMSEGIKLVEADIEVDVRVCKTCGAEAVGPKHKCPQIKPPKPPKVTKRKVRAADADGRSGDDATDRPGTAGDLGLLSDSGHKPAPRIAEIVTARRVQRRWFWSLPFNPDAVGQVLQYLASKGIEAPVDKKTRRATTNKKALKELQAKHRDDPFFQLQLDWKAVQKVDSTYAVGALTRLDSDDRLHPEFLPKPSTFRDSCVGVNLQNVVADKSGPEGLASGFRKCVVARDGVPANRTADEIAAWEAKWGSDAVTEA